MDKDELCIIRLRDCFTAGYTLPQYCVDNGIKNPLFVSEKKFLKFMWEIHVQFCFDKRMFATFSLLDLPKGFTTFSVHSTVRALDYKNFSEINTADFDAIILLTGKPVTADKVISLSTLAEHFISKTYVEIPLLNFLQRHPQVKLFLTKYPSLARFKGGLEFGKQLVSLGALRKILRKNKSGKVKTPLDKFGYTNEEVLELLDALPAVTNSDGVAVSMDNPHPLANVVNGKRTTAAQPETFLNKIYFVGSCHDQGINAPFDKTIASYLQQMLNKNNLPYRVENESQRYWSRYQDIFYTLNTLNLLPGDIVFIWIDNMHVENFPFFDASDAFDPPHDFKEVFFDRRHFNELGYKALAEKYFNFLTENNFFRDVEFSYHMPPPAITVTAYPRNSNRAAQKISSTKSWRLTKKFSAQRNFKSARSS